MYVMYSEGLHLVILYVLYITQLTRQAGNAAREIISTAIGLGIITDSSDVITPHTHIKSKKKKARALSTSSSTKMTFAAEQKVVTKKANFGH